MGVLEIHTIEIFTWHDACLLVIFDRLFH